MSTEVTIKELFGLNEIKTIFPLFSQVNHLEQGIFLARLEKMIAQGNYRCIAAFVDRAMVGAAGFWTGVQLWCGPYVEADHVVVDQAQRSHGIGAQLMAWIEAESERMDCHIIRATMVIGQERTHTFYKRNGYFDDGLLMVKALSRGKADFPEYVA